MLTFPLIDPSVAPQVGAVRSIETATTVLRLAGRERRRILATVPTENLEMRWTPYREDSRWIAEQLAAFFRQTGGPALPFVCYDWDYSFGHQRIYVGTGDGTTTVWNLPCRDTASNIKVYSDGVEVAAGLTLSDDGANEAKKATFAAAPAAGKVLTASFTGQLRIVGRFAEDRLDLEYAEATMYGIRVGIVGLRGEA